MTAKLQSFQFLTRKAPFGLISLLTACVAGGFYAAVVLLPLLSSGRQWTHLADDDQIFWIIIGSGAAMLVALLSLGMERRIWRAVAALSVLLVTENLVFPMMPIWTPMLLAGRSGWMAFLYVLSMVIALGLIARRMIAGEEVQS
jgi:hypothetical protein